MTVAAVILAASPSSALADADGTPGVRRLADIAWSGGATPVVVCSFDPDGAVAAALANAEVTLVDPVDPAHRAGGPDRERRGGRGAARRRDRCRARLAGAARLGRRRDRHDADPRVRRGPLGRAPAGVPRRARLSRPAAGRAPRLVPRPRCRRGCPASCSPTSRRPGVPFRTIETGDPGVVHDVATARADLPPYDGPPEPAESPEWGAGIADQPDDAPVPRPRPARREPVRRVLRVALVVLAILAVVGVVGWIWYTQPQPLLPEATASLASTAGGDVRRGRRPARVVAGRGRARHRARGLPGRQGAARRLRTARPADRRRGLPGRDRASCRSTSRCSGSTRPTRSSPRTRRSRRGRSAGTRWAARWPRSTPGSHDEAIDGLALWAAYPAIDLSGGDFEATSIYGTLDAGAARMGGPETVALLPPDTVFVPIEGGNHEQMGWYTGQPNDPPATITREDQQAQVAEATVAMLEGIGRPVASPWVSAGGARPRRRHAPVARAIPPRTSATPPNCAGRQRLVQEHRAQRDRRDRLDEQQHRGDRRRAAAAARPGSRGSPPTATAPRAPAGRRRTAATARGPGRRPPRRTAPRPRRSPRSRSSRDPRAGDRGWRAG